MTRAFARGLGAVVGLAAILLVGLGLTPDVRGAAAQLTAVPVTVAQGGTGSTTAASARTALGATSFGSSVFTATDAAAGTALISPATTTTAGTIKIRPIDITIISSAASITLTNEPAATTELTGANGPLFRVQSDLTNFTACRFTLREGTGAPATGAKFCLLYSADSGTNWKGLDDVGTNAECGSAAPQVTHSASTLLTSSWVTLASAAKADVLLNIWTDDGDGAADPTIGPIHVQCR